MLEVFLKLHPGVQVMVFIVTGLIVTYIVAVAGPQILTIAASRWQKSEESGKAMSDFIQSQFKAHKEYLDVKNETLQNQIDAIKDDNTELQQALKKVADQTIILAEENRRFAEESRANFQNFTSQLRRVQQGLDDLTSANRSSQPTESARTA